MSKTRITIYFNGKHVFSEKHKNVTFESEENKIMVEWNDNKENKIPEIRKT